MRVPPEVVQSQDGPHFPRNERSPRSGAWDLRDDDDDHYAALLEHDDDPSLEPQGSEMGVSSGSPGAEPFPSDAKDSSFLERHSRRKATRGTQRMRAAGRRATMGEVALAEGLLGAGAAALESSYQLDLKEQHRRKLQDDRRKRKWAKHAARKKAHLVREKQEELERSRTEESAEKRLAREVRLEQTERRRQERLKGRFQSIHHAEVYYGKLKRRVLDPIDRQARKSRLKLHLKWERELYKPVCDAIHEDIETRAPGEATRERQAQMEEYLQATKQQPILLDDFTTDYDPFRCKRPPVPLQGKDGKPRRLVNPTRAVLDRWDRERRIMQKQAQKRRSGGLQSTSRSTTAGREPSQGDVQELVRQQVCASQEELSASHGRWTLPTSLWHTGTIEDTTFARNYPLPGDPPVRKGSSELTRKIPPEVTDPAVQEYIRRGEERVASQRERLVPDWFRRRTTEEVQEAVNKECPVGKRPIPSRDHSARDILPDRDPGRKYPSRADRSQPLLVESAGQSDPGKYELSP